MYNKKYTQMIALEKLINLLEKKLNARFINASVEVSDYSDYKSYVVVVKKMTNKTPSYKERKVITIGVVSELTGLTERQIRYYEERKLIFPERSPRGNRKYSFADVEQLIDIANKREEGVQTYEIRQDMLKAKRMGDKRKRKELLRGEINARFGIQKE